MTEAKRQWLRKHRPFKFRWINGGRRRWERTNVREWDDDLDEEVEARLSPLYTPVYVWGTLTPKLYRTPFVSKIWDKLVKRSDATYRYYLVKKERQEHDQ